MTNYPVILALSFSPRVQMLNTSCFITSNIQETQVSGINPHFFVTVYPQKEGPFSFGLLQNCLVTGTDGSVYPTPHSFISYFDIRPPELSLMFSESLVVGSEMVLVLETSEQVMLVDSIDSIVVSGGELVGLASVSKTLFF